MVRESGRLVAIEPGHLWLATIQRTTCQSCQARSGCGQRLLSSLAQTEGLLKVPLLDQSADNFRIGDELEIGIEEAVLVKASLLAYMLPLLFLLVASALGQYGFGEPGAIVGGLLGLLAGGVLVRWHGHRACVSEYQPQLLSSGTKSQPSDPINVHQL